MVSFSLQENEAYFQKLMEGFKIEKSILNRKDSYDLARGENAVLKGRFESLNRKNLTHPTSPADGTAGNPAESSSALPVHRRSDYPGKGLCL